MRFVVKEYEVSLIGNHSEKAIGIGIEDDFGMVFPCPITNFIKSEYYMKGKSLSSQKNAAYAITRFFNYIYKNISIPFYNSLKVKGLKGIKLEHAAAYITELSLQSRANIKSSNYVKTDLDYINNFFHWLKKQAIPEEDFTIKERESKYSKYNKSRKLIREDVFAINDVDMVYPIDNSITRGRIKTFGENRNELISKFINIARETDPEIVLGVALQILGGLRRSEVINLMDTSLNWSNKGLIVKIRDNQKLLFSDALDTSDNQVKNQRDQVILCTSLVKKLYEEHKKVISKIKGANTPALFISSGTKGSITGKTYSRRFEKVKDAFLEAVLKSGNQQDYLLLTSNTWSTHIGRGIFTNILLDLGLSATQVALARGDRNINSALHYVDEHTMLSNVQDAINNFKILL